MTSLIITSLPVLFLVPLFFLLKKTVGNQQSVTRESENIAVFKETLQVLQQQKAQGEITTEQYEVLYAELARDLLQSPQLTEASAASKAIGSDDAQIAAMPLFFLFLLVIVMSFGVYWQLGAGQDLEIKDELSQMMQLQGEQQMQAYRKTMGKIEHRFQQHPDKVAYGFLLAQQAMSAQQYSKAAQIYTKVLESYPEDPRLLALFAQAQYLSNNRQQDESVRSSLDKALTLEATNTTALGLKGMIAFEQKDYQQALSTWQLLLQQLPPESQQAVVISQGIASARKELGFSPEAQVSAEPLLTVAITIDQQLDLPASTVVFVAIRDKSRGMPVAARRLTVAELPVSLNFSDKDSLMQQRLLSSMSELELVARASLSGQPMAQRGDFQSEVISFELGKQAQLKLNISQLVE